MCTVVACPNCVGDWVCETCWSVVVQPLIWFEEYEADGMLEDSESEVEEGLGSSTECPPTADTNIDFSEAASPDSATSSPEAVPDA